MSNTFFKNTTFKIRSNTPFPSLLAHFPYSMRRRLRSLSKLSPPACQLQVPVLGKVTVKPMTCEGTLSLDVGNNPTFNKELTGVNLNFFSNGALIGFICLELWPLS